MNLDCGLQLSPVRNPPMLDLTWPIPTPFQLPINQSINCHLSHLTNHLQLCTITPARWHSPSLWCHLSSHCTHAHLNYFSCTFQFYCWIRSSQPKLSVQIVLLSAVFHHLMKPLLWSSPQGAMSPYSIRTCAYPCKAFSPTPSDTLLMVLDNLSLPQLWNFPKPLA